jgi:hypothetical protein
MLGRARILFQLNPDLDMLYLEARIRHETGDDHGVEDLR